MSLDRDELKASALHVMSNTTAKILKLLHKISYFYIFDVCVIPSFNNRSLKYLEFFP